MGGCQSEINKRHKLRSLHLKPLEYNHNKIRTETMDEETLKKILEGVFDKFDRNHDGFLDFAEAEELIKHTYLKSNRNQTLGFIRHATRKLFNAADSKNEGRISQEDFYKLYKSS